MSDQIPLDRFPNEMGITRSLVQRLNEDATDGGHISSSAAIAAMIETVGALEVEIFGLKRAVGLS
jgi:hypothetical protein